MEGNILLSTTLKTSGAKGFQRFSENRLAQSDARGLNPVQLENPSFEKIPKSPSQQGFWLGLTS